MFDLKTILYTIPGIIIGLSLHEFCHAIVADKLGDPTPRNQGRLTLSPLVQIDKIGFLFILLLGFGWARPVETNPRYLKNPRRDSSLIALAGPLSNFVLGVFFLILAKLFIIIGILPDEITNFRDSANFSSILFLLLIYSSNINFLLFVLNILPIPPLDGFCVLANNLPKKYYREIDAMYKYGIVILLVILFIPFISKILISIPSSYLLNFFINLFLLK